MPNTDPTDFPIVDQPVAPCRHLRNKGMYVYSDGQECETDDDYDTTVYWCLKSLKNFGPDDEIVGRSECCDPSRACYEPI
jgi:hypothetical protein